MLLDYLKIDGQEFVVPKTPTGAVSSPVPHQSAPAPGGEGGTEGAALYRVTFPDGRRVASVMTAERAAAQIAAGRVVEVVS